MGTTSSEYDAFFQRYSLEFFGPDVDWLWFKAQGIAESNLDPLAVSPVGAVGIMQLMPGTSAEMAERLDLDDLPFIPHININMGIGYDRRCFNIWKQESGMERLRFMFASYNAGPGNIIKAQRRAYVSNVWSSVAEMLPLITGHHADETINYVRRIEKIYAHLSQLRTELNSVPQNNNNGATI
jgi:soluble lytic murein transglycosylase-like protein